MASIAVPVDTGQFDDAPEQPQVTQLTREGNTYIDTYVPANDETTLHWTSEDEDEDYEDGSEDDYSDNRVDDEDWENAERGTQLCTSVADDSFQCSLSDFTKQYNRLRQHAAVRTGNAHGVASASGTTSVATLPAVNIPRRAATKSASAAVAKDRTADQLAALAKYNSKLAKIDSPYVMGVGVNRKGPSAHANIKDKSDRATNEQVLDPRTRLILFKMIGRGLIDEVNGCISTGKEVGSTCIHRWTSLMAYRPMCTTPFHPKAFILR